MPHDQLRCKFDCQTIHCTLCTREATDGTTCDLHKPKPAHHEHICAELAGTNEHGETYHSDICWDGPMTAANGKEWHDWREFVHRNLDEFLDNYDRGLAKEEQYFRINY